MRADLCKTISLSAAFNAALVLTGSAERAEAAVAGAIDTLGKELDAGKLLTQTVRQALRCSTLTEEGTTVLPQELHGLLLLPPRSRCCFILRVLLGFDPETCAEALELSKDEFEGALHRAFLNLTAAMNVVHAAHYAV